MAKRTTKGKTKRAKRAAGPKRTKTTKARASRAKQKSPAKKKTTTGSVTAAASAVASTVMDRLRAWSPSRYTMR